MKDALRRCAAIHILALVLLAGISGCPSKAPPPISTETTQPVGVSRAPANGEATLMLMADIHGVLRPCGCVVELQKGGFDRLTPYLTEERAAHPGSGLLHAGPLFFEKAPVDPSKKDQSVRQSEVTAELVGRIGFTAAGATAVDVAASDGRYNALIERAKLTVTAANLDVDGVKTGPKYTVQDIGTLRIGIFAVAGPAEVSADGHAPADDADHSVAAPFGIPADSVRDPKIAASQVMAALSSKVDVVILLSALGLRETKRLVRKVPGIDFAVVGGLGEHPTFTDEAELVGGTRVMQFHREGRYVGRLAIRVVNGQTEFVDASQTSAAELKQLDRRTADLETRMETWKKSGKAGEYDAKSASHHLASLKSERDRLAAKKAVVPTDKSSFSFTMTPLNWDLPQDPDTLAIMDAFDKELERINIAAAGTLPEAKPGQAVYVGVDACLECHEETKQFWTDTRHSHAWATLEKQNKTFDAECVSCHVTGYKQAGGSLVGQTKGRENVQCESCHGPGSIHADTNEVSDIIAKPTASTCVTCHNTHHSPGFAFGKYRKMLKVPGHGLPL
ncbi:MAG: hypothetical protein ACI9MR_003442 [Myxococcota bacterium]|jgi:hypothetical protein